MHKATAASADALTKAAAALEAVTKTAQALEHRIATLEHRAAPPPPPVVVDRSGEFGDPRAQRETDAQLRQGLQSLPPRERSEATLDLISALRRRQGAPR